MDPGRGYTRVSVVCCLRFHLRCCGCSPRSRYPLPAWLQALPDWSSAATLYPAVSSHGTQAIVHKRDRDLVAHRLTLLGCSPLLSCPEFSTLSQGPHLPPSLTLHLLQVPEHLPLQSSFPSRQHFILPPASGPLHILCRLAGSSSPHCPLATFWSLWKHHLLGKPSLNSPSTSGFLDISPVAPSFLRGTYLSVQLHIRVNAR